MSLKNIKQYVATTITTLFCKHEYEPDNWVTDRIMGLPESLCIRESRNWVHINGGSSKLYFFKCKHCGKLTNAELMTNKLYDIYNKKTPK